MPTPTVFIVVTVVFLAATLAGERLTLPWLQRTAKPLASLGFIATALAAGALDSRYGTTILVGLVFAAVGDVCLMWREPGPFRAGIAAFLLGHVAYTFAFVDAGVAPAWATVAAAAVTAIAAGVLRWLLPHIPAKPSDGSPAMRGPVLAYVVVISTMVAAAFGTLGAGATPWWTLGAVAFYLSDLCVARDRFVVHTFGNRVVGLPLYYGSQLVLAASVGAAA